jgi:hypothetical protein
MFEVAFFISALAAPQEHVIDTTNRPSGLVIRQAAFPNGDVGAAQGGYGCPGPIPENYTHNFGMLSMYWNIIPWDCWPYWAIEIKVGTGGYCSSCPAHGWVPVDVQDGFYGFSPPNGTRTDEAKWKDFTILGEGVYSSPSNPADPTHWSQPITVYPKLSEVTFNDPTWPYDPPPNAFWLFTGMSNLDPWVWEYGEWRQCEECMPDIFMNSEGWDDGGDLCLILQDVNWNVSSLLAHTDDWACPTDFDLNGKTDIPDFLFLLQHWGLPFDVPDFLTFLMKWGGCPYT